MVFLQTEFLVDQMVEYCRKYNVFRNNENNHGRDCPPEYMDVTRYCLEHGMVMDADMVMSIVQRINAGGPQRISRIFEHFRLSLSIVHVKALKIEIGSPVIWDNWVKSVPREHAKELYHWSIDVDHYNLYAALKSYYSPYDDFLFEGPCYHTPEQEKRWTVFRDRWIAKQ